MPTEIAIASDHGGVHLKASLVAYLAGRGFAVKDLGPADERSVDYPDFAHAVAAGIERGEWPRAILVCGTGVGMSMSANRHAGVRAVSCSDVYTATMSRSHNDANVLCLGERVVGVGLATAIVAAWLDTPHDADPRHARRVAKIER